MNDKGFTLLEISITLFIGLSIIYSIMFIPSQLLKIHNYMAEEVKITQSSTLLSAQLYKDIAIEQKNIMKLDNVLKINDELSYVFTDTNIIRAKGSTTKIVSLYPASFILDDNVLEIYMVVENSSNPFVLYFDTSYPLQEVAPNV